MAAFQPKDSPHTVSVQYQLSGAENLLSGYLYMSPGSILIETDDKVVAAIPFGTDGEASLPTDSQNTFAIVFASKALSVRKIVFTSEFDRSVWRVIFGVISIEHAYERLMPSTPVYSLAVLQSRFLTSDNAGAKDPSLFQSLGAVYDDLKAAVDPLQVIPNTEYSSICLEKLTAAQTASQILTRLIATAPTRRSAVNLADELGFTPLHLAAHYDDITATRLVLAAGAFVDAKTQPAAGGLTPLHDCLSTEKGSYRVFAYMIQTMRASTRVPNVYGLAVVDIVDMQWPGTPFKSLLDSRFDVLSSRSFSSPDSPKMQRDEVSADLKE